MIARATYPPGGDGDIRMADEALEKRRQGNLRHFSTSSIPVHDHDTPSERAQPGLCLVAGVVISRVSHGSNF